MELLRDLRVETQQAEAVTSAKAARKRKALAARLEKVRQRKRLKMGLPMQGKSSGGHQAGVGGVAVGVIASPATKAGEGGSRY